MSVEREDRVLRRFLWCIPLYVAVPVVIGWAFTASGCAIDWKGFAWGAAGWWVALLLRAPFALLAKRLTEASGKTLIVSMSGPLEELVRLSVLWMTQRTFAWAASVGQGWAAIEVLFAIVNGLVLASLLKRNDEKAQQVREVLAAQGHNESSPVWGLVERLFASAFHIGATLLTAAHFGWVLLLIPLHSALNLGVLRLTRSSMPVGQLLLAIIGSLTLLAGLLVH